MTVTSAGIAPRSASRIAEWSGPPTHLYDRPCDGGKKRALHCADRPRRCGRGDLSDRPRRTEPDAVDHSACRSVAGHRQAGSSPPPQDAQVLRGQGGGHAERDLRQDAHPDRPPHGPEPVHQPERIADRPTPEAETLRPPVAVETFWSLTARVCSDHERSWSLSSRGRPSATPD